MACPSSVCPSPTVNRLFFFILSVQSVASFCLSFTHYTSLMWFVCAENITAKCAHPLTINSGELTVFVERMKNRPHLYFLESDMVLQGVCHETCRQTRKGMWKPADRPPVRAKYGPLNSKDLKTDAPDILCFFSAVRSANGKLVAQGQSARISSSLRFA